MSAIARKVLLMLVAIAPVALSAAATPPAETVGALLLRLQEESAAPLVQHCVARVPSLKRSLETEYAQFRKRFRKATAPLRAGIGTNGELSRTASRALVRQFEGMDEEMLLQIQKLDPRSYCPTLQENLANATAESMRRNMESAFAQYTAVARQMP
ncbi:MAG: hypothetical protein ABIP83_09055 [Steroidobacteraceae bacterium]